MATATGLTSVRISRAHDTKDAHEIMSAVCHLATDFETGQAHEPDREETRAIKSNHSFYELRSKTTINNNMIPGR